jgi:hypothetical protein
LRDLSVNNKQGHLQIHANYHSTCHTINLDEKRPGMNLHTS